MTATLILDQPNTLYRFFDARARLLYIGITSDLFARFGGHRRDKTWWRDIAGATFEHFPTREAVLAAEEVAIKAERPIHNKQHNTGRRAIADPFAGVGPAGARSWRFINLESGYERVTPLWLYWEVNCDPISDDWSPEEIDAVELWDLWRRKYPPERKEAFGPNAQPIYWYIDGPGTCESAPGQDLRVYDHDEVHTFLDFFTWPVDPVTGERLRFTDLPVVDKVWRTGPIPHGAVYKGGFIQEATGWKPSAYQPYMDVRQIETLAGL